MVISPGLFIEESDSGRIFAKINARFEIFFEVMNLPPPKSVSNVYFRKAYDYVFGNVGPQNALRPYLASSINFCKNKARIGFFAPKNPGFITASNICKIFILKTMISVDFTCKY